MFALSTQVLLKSIVALKTSQFHKKPRLFLVYMPLEPQSGRRSKSTRNIYHQHKNLHKMQLWQSRRLKSSIFLYLKGFKSLSPIKVAVTMRLPLGRMEQGGRGIMKPCIPAYKTTHIFYSNQSLLNIEAESQGFISLLCFLSSSLAFCLASRALHSAQQDSFSRSGGSQCRHADDSTEPVSLIS